MNWLGGFLVVALIVLALALTTGCAQLAGSLPTIKYCEHVSYERKGNKARLVADCTLPIGADLLDVLP